MFSTRLFLVALLAVFGALAFAPVPTDAKITYIRPLWQPTSEWSPPEEREEPAELHSAAMKLYSEYVERIIIKDYHQLKIIQRQEGKYQCLNKNHIMLSNK